MARIFITGSADGLGLLTAQELIQEGHQVVVHGRNKERAAEALRKAKGAEATLIGDLSNAGETRALAESVNASGKFDVVIHNAGVYQVPGETIFAVNTIAPYILTALIHPPKRLIYLTSGMHMQGRANFENFGGRSNRITYSDSKLHVMMLSMAVAHLWPNVYSNAVDPGWVPTRMGGKGAPDDLQKGYETQVWLATSNDAGARVSGKYFHHKKERAFNPEAGDREKQRTLLKRCEELTGVSLNKP